MIGSELKSKPLVATVARMSENRKTIVVSVKRVVVAKIYGKRLVRSTFLQVDNASMSSLAIGQDVKIVPVRRVSKNKSWALLV